MTEEKFEEFACQMNVQFKEMYEQMNKQFKEMYEQMNKQFKEVYEQMNEQFEQVNNKMDQGFAQVNKRLDYLEKDHAELKKVTGIIAKDLTDKLKESKTDRRILHKEIDNIKNFIGLA